MSDGHEAHSGGGLLETQQVLVANWGVAAVSGSERNLNWELLLEALAERIAWLLRHNPGKLVNAMYVLDISEERHGSAMRESSIEAQSRALAQAILERESEKIALRRKYANRPGDLLDGTHGGREASPEAELGQLPCDAVDGD